MKPGNSCVSLPSPYTTHEPSEGRTKLELPVCNITTDCAWFGMSVFMPCIRHISSACWDRFGNRSEIHSPLWPRWRNSYGEATSLPFPSDLPASEFSFGL